MAKKVVNIEDKLKELDAQKRRLEAFAKILNKCKEFIEWEYMDIERDAEGEAIRTEDGALKYVAPSEDSYHYADYMATLSVIDEIKSLV